MQRGEAVIKNLTEGVAKPEGVLDGFALQTAAGAAIKYLKVPSMQNLESKQPALGCLPKEQLYFAGKVDTPKILPAAQSTCSRTRSRRNRKFVVHDNLISTLY
ncbi:hypothetical protein ACOSP7_024670 [Xanthoceras sorbifolium]